MNNTENKKIINPNLGIYRVFIPYEKLSELKGGFEICCIEKVENFTIDIIDILTKAGGLEIVYNYVKNTQ
tara:strand:- start:914 stop:1123 length:210 start_codon:yes stop_codon:yes gene_type:complete